MTTGVNCAIVDLKAAAMPRPISRATLKVPAKPTQSERPVRARDAVGEPVPARKPIRGASKVQQAAAQKANAAAAQAERLAPRPGDGAERDRSRAASEPARAPARVSAPEAPPARRPRADPPAPQAPRPRSERPAPVAKVYPKRGIARSTGARALPPASGSPNTPASSGPHSPAPGGPFSPAPSGAFTRAAPAAPTSTPPSLRTTTPAPDAARPRAPEAAAKPQRRAPDEPPRLSKRISEMTGCSRREADEWIENGWVRVDGQVVTTLGVRVHPSATVAINDAADRHKSESVTMVFNHPAVADEQQESAPSAASGLIAAHNRWADDETRLTFKATHLRGLAPAGKLDAEASGMLVFTQEGSVARRITGDDTRLEKEYLVRVEGQLSPEGLKLLNHGLALDDIKLKRAQVSWQNEQQLRFVLHESRKQQISRMCELVGLRVTSIKRIRIGSVSLGKLPAGQWRYLRENERF